MSQIACAICAITPKEAEELLAKNEGNRKLREHRIDNYVRLMGSGDWVIVGDAICIAPNGRLLNGQHRMAAVVRFGKPVPFLVLRNCPEENFHAMDQGASRNTADLFRSKNIASAIECSAVCNFMWQWMEGARPGSKITGKVASPVELARIYNEYREEIDIAVVIGQRIQRLHAKSRIAFADVLMRLEHGAVVTEFWDQVNPTYPKGLDKGHPSRTLRDHLMADKDSRRMLAPEFIAKCIKAFNAWIEGRELDRMYYNPNEDFPLVTKADGKARFVA